MKKDIIIHIGFPKTGTTSLQNSIFSRISSVHYVGNPTALSNYKQRKLLRTITDLDDYEFFQNLKHHKEQANLTIQTEKEKIIISDEAFSVGSAHEGNVDQMRICQRLKLLFPQAKILICIREQEKLLISYYTQLFKNINPLQRIDIPFEQWLLRQKQLLEYANIFKKFDYWRIYRIYSQIFEKSKIKVIVFEKLIQDLSVLDKVIGIDISENHRLEHNNRKLTKGEMFLQRLVSSHKYMSSINTLIPTFLRNTLKSFLKLTPSFNVAHTSENSRFIQQYYKESNRLLDKELDLKLKELGYSC